MSTLETLRATVAALRKVTGQTQAALAAGVGLTQDKVSRRQSGAAVWTLDDCDALAEHFGITLAELLAGPTVACDALAEHLGITLAELLAGPTVATQALAAAGPRRTDAASADLPTAEPLAPAAEHPKRYQVRLACGDTIGRDYPPLNDTTTCPDHGRQDVLGFDDTGLTARQ